MNNLIFWEMDRNNYAVEYSFVYVNAIYVIWRLSTF